MDKLEGWCKLHGRLVRAPVSWLGCHLHLQLSLEVRPGRSALLRWVHAEAGGSRVAPGRAHPTECSGRAPSAAAPQLQRFLGAVFRCAPGRIAPARGALEGIYVDGVVALPVQLGLNIANVRDPSVLVARGLVSLDVTDPSGAPLKGSVELVLPPRQLPSSQSTADPAWLVWVGEKAFEPNTGYKVQYSFVNDQISSCPEALQVAGVTSFTTGERSAVDDLADASVFFSRAEFHSTSEPNSGCCNVTDATRCQSQDSCVACWEFMLALKDASVEASFALPGAYFALDFSLLAGERPQPISTRGQYVQGASASFAITDPALEYCFQADLRPRAHVDASISTSRCVNAFGQAIYSGLPTIDAMPADACAEAPQLTQTALLFARFGQSEDEARAALPPGLRNPNGSRGTASRIASDGCAIGPRRETWGRDWLLGLLIAAVWRFRLSSRPSRWRPRQESNLRPWL